MIDRDCERLELNKILSACSEYAVLEKTKQAVISCVPSADESEVKGLLNATEESDKLLYRYGLGKVEYFPDVSDMLVRSSKGSALSCGELLSVNSLMRSARIAYEGIDGLAADDVPFMKGLARRLYFDRVLENDITEKILSPDEVSDYASDALFSIRSRIKSLNERIRSKLSEYASGKDRQYLQESIVTVRGDRFVVPVKAEYKSKVRGFVHDRSQSGATFFIEPEYVLELNNELIALTVDEKEEVERILKELSLRVGRMREQLEEDERTLIEIDGFYARAEYAYKLRAVRPQINSRGYINIIKGRHPLIDKNEVVPVSVELGKDYAFLLLSGANTGGKTVTLKMTGLFCLMAVCGLFIPVAQGSSVCVFKKVFCDVGDSQSIEESLSTFSSHITNVISICGKADENSLVLIDELGGGTNPDEGQAIARAVTEELIKKGCKGIITTHFTPLKEFAYSADGIENASMEFDGDTLKPLYSIKIGLAGASNALAISRRLGMPQDILERASSYLSESGRNFENMIERAEKSRIRAAEKQKEAEELKREWSEKLKAATAEEERLKREREKLGAAAKAESRRIINEKTARAEELLSEIEDVFRKSELTETDLIAARTLKNRLKDEAFDDEGAASVTINNFSEATSENISAGAQVYVKTLQNFGEVVSYNKGKNEAEISCNGMKVRCRLSDLQFVGKTAPKVKDKNEVKVVKRFQPSAPQLEINVLGLTVAEALQEVGNFLDKALTDGLEEVKIIHGVGTGKLKAAIAEYLKGRRHIKEFRAGRYGEGEAGVTIVKLS